MIVLRYTRARPKPSLLTSVAFDGPPIRTPAGPALAARRPEGRRWRQDDKSAGETYDHKGNGSLDFAVEALDRALDEAEARKPATRGRRYAWQWPYGEAGEEARRPSAPGRRPLPGQGSRVPGRRPGRDRAVPFRPSGRGGRSGAAAHVLPVAVGRAGGG